MPAMVQLLRRLAPANNMRTAFLHNWVIVRSAPAQPEVRFAPTNGHRRLDR